MRDPRRRERDVARGSPQAIERAVHDVLERRLAGLRSNAHEIVDPANLLEMSRLIALLPPGRLRGRLSMLLGRELVRIGTHGIGCVTPLETGPPPLLWRLSRKRTRPKKRVWQKDDAVLEIRLVNRGTPAKARVTVAASGDVFDSFEQSPFERELGILERWDGSDVEGLPEDFFGQARYYHAHMERSEAMRPEDALSSFARTTLLGEWQEETPPTRDRLEAWLEERRWDLRLLFLGDMATLGVLSIVRRAEFAKAQRLAREKLSSPRRA